MHRAIGSEMKKLVGFGGLVHFRPEVDTVETPSGLHVTRVFVVMSLDKTAKTGMTMSVKVDRWSRQNSTGTIALNATCDWEIILLHCCLHD